jgi:hypothetical protein
MDELTSVLLSSPPSVSAAMILPTHSSTKRTDPK